MSKSRRSNRASITFDAVASNVLKTRGRVAISPDQNILIGTKTIKAYLGIRSNDTFYRLVRDHALPVFPRLDGRLSTSCTLIDYWAFEQAKIARDLERMEKRNAKTD